LLAPTAIDKRLPHCNYLHEEFDSCAHPSNLLAPADVFAATIVSLEASNHCGRRVSVRLTAQWSCSLHCRFRAVRTLADRNLVSRLRLLTGDLLSDRLTVMARYTFGFPAMFPLGDSLAFGSALLALSFAATKHPSRTTGKETKRGGGNRSPTPFASSAWIPHRNRPRATHGRPAREIVGSAFDFLMFLYDNRTAQMSWRAIFYRI